MTARPLGILALVGALFLAGYSLGSPAEPRPEPDPAPPVARGQLSPPLRVRFTPARPATLRSPPASVPAVRSAPAARVPVRTSRPAPRQPTNPTKPTTPPPPVRTAAPKPAPAATPAATPQRYVSSG